MNTKNETFDNFQTHGKQPQHLAREVFDIQRSAFLSSPYPSEKLRKQQLVALKKAILKHKEKLVKAISADFGCRSTDESLLADILPTIMGVNHSIKHLRQWMKPEKRPISILYQPAKARIMYQPKGVVGIISPWNYPVFLSLGPLATAIAAGNRVMLKPSEFSPHSNRVLKAILEDAFSTDEVCMVEGDASVASKFTQLPFDHILYTGSTEIGKKVMAAAAENLTPVTLELGGKSPAIIAPDVSADFAVGRMLYGKCLNGGQTCVTSDYVLCPEDKLADLIKSFKAQFKELYPNVSNGQYTSIVNDAHHQRITDWLKDATDKGAKVIPLAKSIESQPRLIPLQLVTNVDPSMTIMQQEIFGPVLPIVTYKKFSEALEFVQSQPRPLALYLFTFNKKLENQTLHTTHAGGICINDTVYHVAQDDLPFGGIGPSGMGNYHAREGFLTFSHAKSIFKRGRFNSAKFAFPPYGKLIHKLIYKFFLR